MKKIFSCFMIDERKSFSSFYCGCFQITQGLLRNSWNMALWTMAKKRFDVPLWLLVT